MHSLNNIINLRDVNTFVISTTNFGKMLIYLHNDNIRHSCNGCGNSGIDGEIEVSMLVHRSNADHNHIDIKKKFIVGCIVVEHHGNIITKSPVAKPSLVSGTMPTVIDKMFLALIALCHCNRS